MRIATVAQGLEGHLRSDRLRWSSLGVDARRKRWRGEYREERQTLVGRWIRLRGGLARGLAMLEPRQC